MQRRIIILKGRYDIPLLRQILLERNPDLDVTVALGLEDLTAAIDRFDGRCRLIGFLTGIIVPADLLARLKITPYNIHPGPPEFPGAHPVSFAIWHEAQTYGVTAHEMTARVDAGPIVAVCRFPTPPEPEHMELADLTVMCAIDVFEFVGNYCAMTDEALPPMKEQWASEKSTRKQFQELCRTIAPPSSDKAARLARACGADLAAA